MVSLTLFTPAFGVRVLKIFWFHFQAWDQSDKFMKIYVTINGVHKVPKENIVTEFTPK